MTDADPADTPHPPRPDDRDPLEVVSYLWVEYQYRHDMVWKLAFRITAVAALLLIAPFLADESVQKAVGYGLAALPFLAILVIAGGMFTLRSELSRLDLIRDAYRAAQEEVLEPYVNAKRLEREQRPQLKGDPQPQAPLWKRLGSLHFAQRVHLYFVVLLVAASIYFIALVSWWLPNLVDQAQNPEPAPSSAAAVLLRAPNHRTAALRPGVVVAGTERGDLRASRAWRRVFSPSPDVTPCPDVRLCRTICPRRRAAGSPPPPTRCGF